MALTRRRLGSLHGFEEYTAAFGETLEWRNEDLGWNLGVVRRAATLELSKQLDSMAGGFATNAFALLTVSEHINSEASGAWRLRPNASRHKLDVLCELHSQALGVTQDVVSLILAGSPAGASARWRSLYELSTIAKFIARSPNDVADRYQSSHLFELRKETRLRIEAIGRKDRKRRVAAEDGLRELDDACERLVKRHDASIIHPYGWAAKQLKQKRVTFRDLEERVQTKASRLRYMEASQHVHAQRLSSIKTLRRGKAASSLFVGGPLDASIVQVDTVWTLQAINDVLASLVYRRQGVPEAIYWSYAAHMFALDAATDTWRSPYTVDTGHLRERFSISGTTVN